MTPADFTPWTGETLAVAQVRWALLGHAGRSLWFTAGGDRNKTGNLDICAKIIGKSMRKQNRLLIGLRDTTEMQDANEAVFIAFLNQHHLLACYEL